MECFLRSTVALLLVSSLSNILPCHSSDRLGLGQSISGNETLVSGGGAFAMGFFSPNGSAVAAASRYWYVGIWHNKVTVTRRRIVWVANRDSPVMNLPGVLRFSDDRNFVIADSDGKIVWSSNSSTSSSANDTWAVVLEDNGNLVVRKDKGEDVWRSFDHPTDTILPGMSLTLNYRTKVGSRVTCWRSDEDPSPGNYSLGIDPATTFQLMMEGGGKPHLRGQLWKGGKFSKYRGSELAIGLNHAIDDEWVNFTFTFSVDNVVVMGVVNHTGVIQVLLWLEGRKDWSMLYTLPSGACQHYGRCGEFGVCDNTAPPLCKCLEGFEPKNQTEWDGGDFHGGCARKNTLQCKIGTTTDSFSTIHKMKVPDQAIFIENVSSSNCNKLCLPNCSCTAYTHSATTKDSLLNGCFLWTGELMDLVKDSTYTEYLQIRLAAGTTMGKRTKTKTKTKIIILVVIISVSIALLCVSLLCCFFMSKRKNGKGNGEDEEQEDLNPEGADLSFFEFNQLVAATDNYSDSNKIGRGGFGIVYKGILTNGLEIAIKRLSKISRQGLEEFKNEVMVIAKLQHKNLVKLLGYCVQEEEKILIYEFLPNGSLDSFLFSNERRMLLDWKKRFNIVKGIAKGLLYLHEDSRLRIIHRDLKAGNVLLDQEMNPKISDFGMARIFESNQNEANTLRVVGTYGYMSPEYAMKGYYSVKSDVYSYGVLILEILSGKKMTNFCTSSFLNLLSHAWQLWEEERLVELVDPSMVGRCEMEKALRCMHIALLCIQDHASDRPTMSSVVHMLENEFVPLDHKPQRPTFTAVVEVVEGDIVQDLRLENIPQSSSINDVTITEEEGR